MIRAISEYRIGGVRTTLGFGSFAVDSEPFRSGDFDTGFVKQHFSPEMLNDGHQEGARVAALVAAHVFESQDAGPALKAAQPRPRSSWQKHRS
jgi:acetyl/propionyl-CoA carboxylase alpha subunit